MAKYEMQVSNLPPEEGQEAVTFPRMVIERQVDTEELVRRASHGTTFGEAETLGCLRLLARELAYAMAQGCSVRLEGIGTFTPALGLRRGKEREQADGSGGRRNATSVRVKDVNFRASPGLVREVDRWCRLKRSDRKFARSSDRYTEQERLELARGFLRQHGRMLLWQYCQLTGLLKDKASRELRRWTERREETGITSTGRGPVKAWVPYVPSAPAGD